MTFDKIKNIIVENLGVSPEEVKLDSLLSDDLGADSLDAVEISMAIEEEFGIDIPDEVLEKFKKVSDIVNFVDKENE
ncbi:MULTISPECIES: acyl carrier protein [Peptoniphilus]|uniref:Acyl carrier protein n=2 Tax=Peptoniphilus lacrimalis TaxID=33031 RepID=D1VVH1_9FIRM|nr:MULTISPECIES: acyl carrier protein [Peptoniphilus]KGF37060.1 acyl carrier protein [Peptoniphilus lacrimalis DNF00528]EFA89446.1 acyl carrier protein [Peptoniphilus lacrimalis 315-B]EFK39486.1 acyl carrier protein [Peptoniphilus sp. oral taxon 836 str. F0141]MDK7722240.1 acyl carrier protein [Peptoniphilus lacrimalis]MDK7731842.1 acyl carrier protein [Peptoniphilus lacrimalis]